MKLSFSISSSKPTSTTSRPNPTKAPDDGDSKPQFVTVFDPSKPLASSAAARVIPPIPNSDILHPSKKLKNLPLPSDDDPAAAPTTHFVLDTYAADPSSSAIPYGLSIRSNPNPNPNSDAPRPAEDSMLRRYHEDMKILPDDRGMEEFEDIPVEGYGAALLAGYGWSEGKGIGRNNKGDTKIVQYERRAGNEGLGYVPKPGDPKVSRRRDGREGKKPPPASLPAPPPSLSLEMIVRVISGQHAGLKGKVVERAGRDEIILNLLESGDEIQVGEHMVAQLGSAEEERCLKKLKELEIQDREERRNKDGRRDEKKSRSSRTDERRSRDEQAKQVEKSSGDRWLTSHIKVRVVSRDFMGGKLYRQKAKVLDVVGPTACDIQMDESGELVQGVDQEVLETALPRRGGSVLVLYGKHKGAYGSLVERDMEKETGVVRDADSYAMIKVRLDQIAEFVGDPSYLGY